MKISRRAFLKKCGMAGVAGGLGYGGLVEPRRLALDRVRAPIARLPLTFEGFKIAVMSDFHLQPYTPLSLVESAVEMANSVQPDAVVLLGDYGYTLGSIHELAPVFSRLKAKHGVFAILGNHDRGGMRIIPPALEQVGITVLRNSGVPISIGNEQLFMAGTESIFFGFDLEKSLAGRTGNAPTILLAHEPDVADTVAADGRVSLQLSGHSHGGQVRMPVTGALLLPPWGRRYDQGLYKIKEMLLYTNRGIGIVGLPFRLNCLPEVTEITLCGLM